MIKDVIHLYKWLGPLDVYNRDVDMIWYVEDVVLWGRQYFLDTYKYNLIKDFPKEILRNLRGIFSMTTMFIKINSRITVINSKIT